MSAERTVRIAMTPEGEPVEYVLAERSETIDSLRATVRTLLARVESLERTVAGLKTKEQDVRRAVGQLASAYDVLRK